MIELQAENNANHIRPSRGVRMLVNVGLVYSMNDEKMESLTLYPLLWREFIYQLEAIINQLFSEQPEPLVRSTPLWHKTNSLHVNGVKTRTAVRIFEYPEAILKPAQFKYCQYAKYRPTCKQESWLEMQTRCAEPSQWTLRASVCYTTPCRLQSTSNLWRSPSWSVVDCLAHWQNRVRLTQIFLQVSHLILPSNRKVLSFVLILFFLNIVSILQNISIILLMNSLRVWNLIFERLYFCRLDEIQAYTPYISVISSWHEIGAHNLNHDELFFIVSSWTSFVQKIHP